MMSVSCWRMMNNKFLILFFFFAVIGSTSSSDVHEDEYSREGVIRGLKSFKETASGTNVTFDCSPSGPCLPCLYSEKKDETYRCSETGYRIPMRCVKIDEDKDRRKNIYLTYRSCIPAVNQENLSLLAFEAIMLLLLIITSFVIFRRKATLVMPGAIRLPTNPRF